MAKKKVVYKIVQSEHRNSFSVVEFNRYCKHYYPNTIVKAVKGTLGVMCFETKEDAKGFINSQCVWVEEELDIIDVRPIGKAHYPKSICAQTEEDVLNNFYEGESMITMYPPKGTVCYDSVEVLT